MFDTMFPNHWSTIRKLMWLKKITGGGSRIPTIYQEVEYVESDGAAYIDSGIECTSDLAVEFKFYAGTDVNASLCGGIDTRNPQVNFRHHASPYSKNRYWIQNDNINVSSVYAGTTFDILNPHVWEIDPISGKAKLDANTSTFTPLVSGLTTTKNYGIFARIADTGAIQSRVSSIYYFKFYRNSALIGDFIPCYRKEDGVIGMYDTVTKSFFTNAGTGAFTKGPDV